MVPVFISPLRGGDLMAIIWNPAIDLKTDDEQGLIYFISESGAVKLDCRKTGFTASFIKDVFAVESHNDEEMPSLEPLRQSLLSRNYLIKVESTEIYNNKQFGYYSSWCKNPEKCIKNINSAKVAIAGLGGTGSVVLQHMVGAGVRKFSLRDMDFVNYDNFNRQFIFKKSDVGKWKVDVSRDYIIERSPNALVKTNTKKVDTAKDLIDLAEGNDILICCIDTPAGSLEYFLNEVRVRAGVPTINAAVGLKLADCGYVQIGDTGFDGQSSTTATANRDPIPWSFGPTNTITAALMAKRAIHWIAEGMPIIENRSPTLLNFDDLDV